MQTVIAPGSTTNTRRIVAFIVVVAIHVVLIWGLNAGLTDIIKEKILSNLQTVEIATPKEEEEKPPPPPPKLETPPPFVPPPDIAIEVPVQETTTAIQQVTTVKPVEAPPPVVVREVPATAPKFKRPPGTTDDFYPSASKRAGEEGSVVVALHVLEDGSIDKIEIAESSGFPRLDQGAIPYVKTWRLSPATQNGKPVATTWKVRVTFKLKS